MAVTVVNDRAIRAEAIAESMLCFDPFILSTPCWKIRVLPQLPDEVVDMRPTREQLENKDREKIMAIRTVAAAQAPARLFVRGGISSKSDYVELLAALNNGKPDQAFIVDMDPKAWVKADGSPIPKAEVVFANSLRRRFDAGGLNITAYQSGVNQVTVRRLTTLEIKERDGGKGKKSKKS